MTITKSENTSSICKSQPLSYKPAINKKNLKFKKHNTIYSIKQKTETGINPTDMYKIFIKEKYKGWAPERTKMVRPNRSRGD